LRESLLSRLLFGWSGIAGCDASALPHVVADIGGIQLRPSDHIRVVERRKERSDGPRLAPDIADGKQAMSNRSPGLELDDVPIVGIDGDAGRIRNFTNVGIVGDV